MHHRILQRRTHFERLERRELFSATPGSPNFDQLLSSGVCNCAICTGQGESALASDPSVALAASTASGPAALPALSSNPTAKAKLYLDFNGHFQADWGRWSNVATPAFDRDGNAASLSSGEVTMIREVWASVAEDYAPFNIDVTTIAPGSLADRVVAHIAIGGDGSWYSSGAGGVAYVGGFYSSASNVGYVFADNLSRPKSIADAATHEAGHLFGLSHQSAYSGTQKTQDYYRGNAAWAPLMGNSYSAARSTWHNGASSTSSTSFQDEIAILGGPNNGFGLKVDDFGSTIAAASALPVNGTSVRFAGLIGHHSDQDVWRFTTGGGSVSFSLDVAEFGPNLDAVLEIRNASGSMIATSDPSTSLDAQLTATLGSGTYYVVARGDGSYGNMGQYTLSGTVPAAATTVPTAPPAVTASSWGTIDFYLAENRQATGSQTFAATATRSGLFTVESHFSHNAGDINLEVYNTSGQLLGRSNSLANSERVDLNVVAGLRLVIRVLGTNSNVTYRCANLVSASAGTVNVYGTPGDDLLVMSPGSASHRVSVNGVNYDFSAATFNRILVQAQTGVDTLSVLGSEQSESATISATRTLVTSSGYLLSVSGMEYVELNAGGGSNSATIHDRAGSDTYRGSPTQGLMSGAGYRVAVNDFARVDAVFSAGFDQAFLYGSIGNDRFEAAADKADLQGPGFRHNISGHDTVVGVGGLGDDLAVLHDTAGGDIFHGDPDAATLSNAATYLRAEMFDRVEARSSSGHDVAFLRDSTGDDVLGASKILAYLNGVGFSNYVEGFALVSAASSGGFDTAYLYDTAGDDRLEINGGARRLAGVGYSIQANDFRTFNAYASLGNDTVTLQQLVSSDKLLGRANWATLSNANGRIHNLTGFDAVAAVASARQKLQGDVQAIDYLFSKLGA